MARFEQKCKNDLIKRKNVKCKHSRSNSLFAKDEESRSNAKDVECYYRYKKKGEKILQSIETRLRK
jgi:hypothetical protein